MRVEGVRWPSYVFIFCGEGGRGFVGVDTLQMGRDSRMQWKNGSEELFMLLLSQCRFNCASIVYCCRGSSAQSLQRPSHSTYVGRDLPVPKDSTFTTRQAIFVPRLRRFDYWHFTVFIGKDLVICLPRLLQVSGVRTNSRGEINRTNQSCGSVSDLAFISPTLPT